MHTYTYTVYEFAYAQYINIRTCAVYKNSGYICIYTVINTVYMLVIKLIIATALNTLSVYIHTYIHTCTVVNSEG